MVEKKWNLLIGISRTFCNLTTHCYSMQLLHFTMYAQTILHTDAAKKTEAKKDELEKRT